MESSILPIISIIFKENFEKMALVSAQYNPLLWLRYVDDKSVSWPHGPSSLEFFFNHLNSLRSSIQFTMEVQSDSAIHFLGVLVITKGGITDHYYF
jgi:hypothetical protein